MPEFKGVHELIEINKFEWEGSWWYESIVKKSVKRIDSYYTYTNKVHLPFQ